MVCGQRAMIRLVRMRSLTPLVMCDRLECKLCDNLDDPRMRERRPARGDLIG